MYKKSKEFHVNNKLYFYQFHLGFLLFWLAFFLLFCLLGCWQLARFHTKKTLLMTYETRLAGPTLSLSMLSAHSDDIQFQPISVSGHYLFDKTILIQNRFYRDKVGYEVITPFVVTGQKKLLLVDRGWIPAKVNNNTLKTKEGDSTIILHGYIKLLNEYQFTLGKNSLNPEQKPLVIQKIEVGSMQQQLHSSMYPYLLRIDEGEKGAFVRDWIITNVIPERHMAYAVQWFMMAFAVVIAYLCFSIERKK